MTADRDLQDSAIAHIERTGEPIRYFNEAMVEYCCSKCDVAISEEQSAYKLCESCEKSALQRFKDFLCNEFDNAEREYIDACTEGVSLTEPNKFKDIKAVY